MEFQKTKARKAWSGSGDKNIDDKIIKLLGGLNLNKFSRVSKI